ncbi:hypothetical protein VP01_1378g3 [Puccinia sorghi]|uniref:Mitochondrial import inner membrane translocase subunit TIM16 n=1 Tax=Puccinia sorghi TaxID=27349 RepID=A0A0L6VM16_9BASI|nr:hypothetical protein VP01_1378g3 [Puccinia sorghi]
MTYKESVGLNWNVADSLPRIAQSLPRIVSQVVILGSQILGKAFVEAYRQAARSEFFFPILVLRGSGSLTMAIRGWLDLDARSGTSHAAGAGERGGGANLGSMAGDGSVITRKHKMTVDEACQILNVKNVPFSEGPSHPIVSEELANMLKAYERMYQANEKTSKYLLSKVVRAKDRISAEVELTQNSKPQP